MIKKKHVAMISYVTNEVFKQRWFIWQRIQKTKIKTTWVNTYISWLAIYYKC